MSATPDQRRLARAVLRRPPTPRRVRPLAAVLADYERACVAAWDAAHDAAAGRGRRRRARVALTGLIAAARVLRAALGEERDA